MTNLRSAISQRIEEAWNTARPDPEPSDVLTESWNGISNAARANLINFAERLIGQLIHDGKLKAAVDYSEWTREALATLQHHAQDLDASGMARRIDQATELAKHMVSDELFEVLTSIVGFEAITPRHIDRLADNGILIDASLYGSEAPQDDWQECTFSEIRKGDRVKRVVTHAYDTTETVEGVVAEIDDETYAWAEDLRIFLAGPTTAPNITLYRIPAPVVRPNPAEHPTIANVKIPDNPDTLYRIGVAERNGYMLFADPQDYPSLVRPEDITEWQPADVFAKGDDRG